MAFGWNDVLNVLDVSCMLDVERYRRVDIDAKDPASLYPDRAQLAPEANTRFLVDCVRRFREVNFADQASGRIYAHLDAGKLVWIDPEALAAAAVDADTHAGLLAAAEGIFDRPPAATSHPSCWRTTSGAIASTRSGGGAARQAPRSTPWRGSSASRRPSPSRLNDSTSRKIDSPGQIAIHGALSM